MTMVAQLVSGAEFRCRRLLLGLKDDQFAAVAQAQQRAVPRWETRDVVPPRVINILDRLDDIVDDEYRRLMVDADTHGVIRTFITDDQLRGAKPEMLFASVHHTVAGMVARNVPGTRVMAAPRTASPGDVEAQPVQVDLLCRSAILALGVKQLSVLFDNVHRKLVVDWVNGERPIPQGIQDTIDRLDAIALAHVDELRQQSVIDGRILICATKAELQQRWPDLELPLSTHTVAAGWLAAQDNAITGIDYYPAAVRDS